MNILDVRDEKPQPKGEIGKYHDRLSPENPTQLAQGRLGGRRGEHEACEQPTGRLERHELGSDDGVRRHDDCAVGVGQEDGCHVMGALELCCNA